MDIWTLWHPTYWLSGFVKAVTAVVSLYTASTLVRLLPKVLALPSPAQLEAANQALQEEIRERLEVEQALSKSETLYRAIVEDQTELICRYLPDTTLTFVNGAYCRFFGKNRDELLGRSFLPLIPEEEREQVTTLIKSLLTLTPDRPVTTSEHGVIVNGEIRWYQWSDRAIFDQQGNIIEFQCVGRDITEHKQAEELKAENLALEAAKHYAESANRAKSQFLANMTHELRTPLNSILGFTQLLSRDLTLTASQHQQLGIITRSGEHLLALINDVLEMSKIEAGKTQLNPSSFDLYHLIGSIEEMLQLKAQSKGLQLIFELTPDVPQYVQTDESKLRQVLINLLGNAIKFTEAGTVTLRVSSVMANGEDTTNYQLHFEVEDTGPGIAPDELDTLFDAFVQTETGRKSQEGTGLGLAISHKFVELMGGELTVRSTLGQGTTVAFDILVTLAREGDIYGQMPTKRAIALAPEQPTYRILVVEDKWENRQLLVKLLEPLGFEVREATNGQEGVDLWHSWKPHLILMDMRMPVMDGYEATKRIRKAEVRRIKDKTKAEVNSMKDAKTSASESQLQNPQQLSRNPLHTSSFTLHTSTVIIAITASAFDEERAVVMSAGCDAFLRKPFHEPVLLEKIAEHLGVQYLYEEVSVSGKVTTEGEKIDSSYPARRFGFCSAAGRTGTATSNILHPSSFQVMPSTWLSQLNYAALCGDYEQLLSLLEEIPEPHAALKLALANLVDNFRLDLIIDLTPASSIDEAVTMTD